MDLQEFSEKFRLLASKEKIKYIHEQIHNLKEKEKIPFLLSIIKDKKSSPLVRATALMVLSQTSYPETSFYQEYTKDSCQTVASAAKKALIQLKKKDKKYNHLSLLALTKIKSSKEKQKRLKIIKSLAQVKGSWVNEVLLEALDDPSEEIRDFIIKEMGKREYFDLNMIYKKLSKPPWYVKSSALRILGIRKDQQSLKLFKATLNDPNAEVRRSAAQALGEIGGKEALVFLNKLAKDKNRFVKRTAEEGLRKASRLKFS